MEIWLNEEAYKKELDLGMRKFHLALVDFLGLAKTLPKEDFKKVAKWIKQSNPVWEVLNKYTSEDKVK